jgi:hypothetical protein
VTGAASVYDIRHRRRGVFRAIAAPGCQNELHRRFHSSAAALINSKLGCLARRNRSRARAAPRDVARALRDHRRIANDDAGLQRQPGKLTWMAGAEFARRLPLGNGFGEHCVAFLQIGQDRRPALVERSTSCPRVSWIISIRSQQHAPAPLWTFGRIWRPNRLESFDQRSKSAPIRRARAARLAPIAPSPQKSDNA